MSTIQVSGHTVLSRPLSAASVVIDLGANHGEFSKGISRLFGSRCIVVEGNRRLVEEMAASSNFRIIHAVVGHADGTAELSIAENDQCSTILPFARASGDCFETVRMISMPSLLKSEGLKIVDLVKMDIEGAEIIAIDACPDETLQRIGQLALEFHESQGWTQVTDIHRIATRLERLGFVWVRGTFSNFEDNLFINTHLCRVSKMELWMIRSVWRYWNGIVRVVIRLWKQLRPQKTPRETLI